jgi:acyl-CoA synthetase (NDP forming)
VVAQTGAVPVTGFEALVDATMSFALLPGGLGNRIAVISGPGGLAVSAADPGVDAVVIIGIGLNEESNQRFTETMIQIRRGSRKPFLMVNIPGFAPELG